MKVWANDTTIMEALRRTNGEFDNNVELKEGMQKDGRAWRLTLRVKDSSGPGARRGQSGRRTVAACWHVHRQFMEAIFNREPDARIQTALADYKGYNDFLSKFATTGGSNVGSIIAPRQLTDLCEC